MKHSLICFYTFARVHAWVRVLTHIYNYLYGWGKTQMSKWLNERATIIAKYRKKLGKKERERKWKTVKKWKSFSSLSAVKLTLYYTENIQCKSFDIRTMPWKKPSYRCSSYNILYNWSNARTLVLRVYIKKEQQTRSFHFAHHCCYHCCGCSFSSFATSTILICVRDNNAIIKIHKT